jgi:glycosyltransferase involved in cell wall biosynthesis
MSIIVPTCNRSTSLRRALLSFINQDFPATDYEILVIDNVSTDDTRAACEEMIGAHPGHAIRYIYEPIPGTTPARHRGAAAAKSPILVFTDDDIEADRGWLSAIHDAFHSADVHVVGGKSLPKYAVEPPAWLQQIANSGPESAKMLRGYYSLLDLGDRRLSVDPTFVWSLNYAIRKETFYRVGGFNPDLVPPRYRRYQGDGETGLSLKLRESGLTAIYEPRALVHHHVQAERLAIEYLEKRKYFQGVCDSYTSVRKTGQFGFIAATLAFPENDAQWLAYRTGAAYACGYNWHQNEVKNDTRLLQWVRRPDYFDCNYPE